MSVTYFCPSCWSEVGTETVCPKCGQDLQEFSGKSYEEKLIRALRHPEPTVPVRAATILGELGSRAAVEPLMDIATSTKDLYLQEAAIEALGQIGDVRALASLGYFSREGAVRVRVAATRAIAAVKERQDASKR
ncbi:MAG TPA: HEAT repeat domain-containing protein [Terriglobia bacterium]|jgi:HEAT repeat protein|nr:HEAT repeat domain-containing protein [Terriglobia bacterium]